MEDAKAFRGKSSFFTALMAERPPVTRKPGAAPVFLALGAPVLLALGFGGGGRSASIFEHRDARASASCPRRTHRLPFCSHGPQRPNLWRHVTAVRCELPSTHFPLPAVPPDSGKGVVVPHEAPATARGHHVRTHPSRKYIQAV